MAEKTGETDDQNTQETIISATRREALNVGQTAKTVINPDQAAVDQLGETVVSRTVTEEDILEQATMETMFERVTDDTHRPTIETALLGPNETGSTRPGPMQGGHTRRSESGAKYEIVRSLGKGGFAWVYLVKNVDLDRLEAMKILNTELAEDEEVLDRFVKEARTSARFNHQNIVTVFEVSRSGDWANFKADEELVKRHRQPFAYFTMSFVEGQTATNLIKKKTRIPQKDAIRVVMDACAALDYAHAKGVVHRDIKPDNILVDNKGMGIVMDFGIAKVVDQTRQTAAGTFMGTARYVSPEQAMGRDIDARSDLYSLGVTLYELATGRVPFDSDQWMTVLYQHINEAPPSPEKFYGDIDRNLRSVILKMLEKRPEDRFQTAREVLDALQRIYMDLGGEDRRTRALDEIDTRRDFSIPQQTSVTQVPSQPPPVRTKMREPAAAPPAPKKSMMPLLVGAVVLVALAIVGYVVFGPKAPPEGPPLAAQGKLQVSAFPTGKILQISNKDGVEIPVTGNELPQILDLPSGAYTIVVGYQDVNKPIETFVTKDALSRVHFEFDVDEANFLLEDLR